MKLAKIAAAAIQSVVLCGFLAAPALADNDRRGRQHHGWEHSHKHHHKHRQHYKHRHGGPNFVIIERRHFHAPKHRHRHFHSGYGHYRSDRDAWRWLGLAAITVNLIDALTEHQHRAHEQSQIRALGAPIGQPIVWSAAGAGGSVVALREGVHDDGRYCREFQQTVTIGGRTEQAYGTACQQPDGAWQVVG